MAASSNILEGILLDSESRRMHLWDEGTTVPLDPILERIQGDFVVVRLTLVPSDLLPYSSGNTDSWAGGACKWQPAECPMGHHEDPNRDVKFEVQGILCREGETWRVDGVEVPFSMFEGHYSRFEAFPCEGSLRKRAQGLRSLLMKIKREI